MAIGTCSSNNHRLLLYECRVKKYLTKQLHKNRISSLVAKLVSSTVLVVLQRMNPTDKEIRKTKKCKLWERKGNKNLLAFEDIDFTPSDVVPTYYVCR